MKDLIIKWIGILLFIAVSILIVRLFIWLLPILLVALIAYYIYDYLKDKLKKEDDIVIEKARKNKSHKKKNKKIIIIDEEK